MCKARIIAVSYKDVANPKIGLTMRQEQLGKLEWIEENNSKKTETRGAKNSSGAQKSGTTSEKTAKAA